MSAINDGTDMHPDDFSNEGSGVRFTVPGVPVAKGRPRASAVRGFVHLYSDKKTASYENLVKMVASQTMWQRKPLEGPLFMDLVAYIPIPKSKSKKIIESMLLGTTSPTSRPDLDNYIKSVSDGCNKLVFNDDSQIVIIHASKRYSDTPRLEVFIAPL